MYLYILSSVLCCSFLFGDEVASLVNMTAMPSSVVGGVNVITGDYIEYGEEYVVAGPDSYPIGHTYVSSSLEEGSLGDGWNFFHDHLLEIQQPAGIHYVTKGPVTHDVHPYHNNPPTARRDTRGPNSGVKRGSGGAHISKKYIFATLDEAFGGKLAFVGEYRSHKLSGFKVQTKNTGFTNVHGGQISGKTNIKNIRLHYHAHNDSWKVTLGDGTTRIYSRQWKLSEMKESQSDRKYAKKHRDYHLVKEIKPSGNTIKYDYNDDHEITRMRLLNIEGVELSHAHFKQRKYEIPVKTSDNQECLYKLRRISGVDQHGKKLKDTCVVSGIERPGLPAVHFIYDDKSENHIRRLERKEYADGNFVKIKYYRPHENAMLDRKARILASKKERRFNKNRVRYVQAPVGSDSTPIITHSYNYYPDGARSGHADVFDAHQKRTRYSWNKNRRLVSIERYNNDNKLEMAEGFVWGTGKLTGHLMVQTLFDGDYNPKYSRVLSYDAHGNILKETLYGRFTTNSGSFTLDSEGYPTHVTCDALETHYTYSKDGFNLKTAERDPDGNYTYYSYVKGTNLLAKKLICDKKKICRREFFRYDESAILIEKIRDDGSSRDPQEMTDVTERYITRIQPRKKQPHFGEPEIIEEFYVDGHNLVPLKKSVNTFAPDKGFCLKNEVFDATGTLASVTEFGYDDAGRIIYSKDPVGRVERFSYNASGFLAKKELPNSTTRYYYDLAGRLIREEEDLPGRPTLIRYYTIDNLGRKIHEIDPQNNHTYYDYDSLNRLTKISYPPLYDEEGGLFTPTKKIEYKKLGTIKRETDENGNTTTTIYSAAGKVFEERFPDGTVRSCSYDKKGNLVKEVLPNGVEVDITYDAFGRMTSSVIKKEATLLSEKKYRYSSGHLVEEVSPTGEITCYTYDKAGRKKSSTLNGARTTSFHYDALGRLDEEQTSDYIKRYSYDACDRVTGEYYVDQAGTMQSYKLYGYDVDGNRSEERQGQFATTKTEFLAHAIPSKRIDALGNTWEYTYNHYFQNQHGQFVWKKCITDPRGVRQEELLDANGNISEETLISTDGLLLAKKELFYDGAHNCILTLEHSIVDGKSCKVIRTEYLYGPGNRLEKIVEAASTPEAKATIYFYNDFGQRWCTRYSDNTKLFTFYDDKGRVANFQAEDGSLNYSYTYDASDKILEVENHLTKKKTLRTYNSLGELVSETLESGLAVQYGYDGVGRVNKLMLPDNSSVGYGFRGHYLQTVTRFSPEYEPLWQHSIRSRDLAGKPLEIQLAKNAGTIKGKIDPLLRTVKLEHPQYVQEAVEFDSVGNLLAQTTHDAVGHVVSTYSYDYLSQLIHEEGFSSHSYAYDSLYDRLRIDERAYEINSLHSVLADQERHFTYDARGNRLSDGTLLYRYDALDRLIEVETPGVSRTTYSYDAFDRRIEKVTNGSRTQYLYALQNEIGAVDPEGNITEFRVLGEGLGAEIGATVGIELQHTLYVPLHDLRGNIVALLNPDTAQVAESYRYDAFGNEELSDASLGNPWRFSSKRVDEETQLVYFGRRYYDPCLGKWLTHDPLGLKSGPNLYAYVLNNPLTHFDLYGLLDEEENSGERSWYRRAYDSISEVLSEMKRESVKAVEDKRDEISRDIHETMNFFRSDPESSPQPNSSPNSFDTNADFLHSDRQKEEDEDRDLSLAAKSAGWLAGKATHAGLEVAELEALSALKITRWGLKAYRWLKGTYSSGKTNQNTNGSGISTDNLPRNPNDLLKKGYVETTHPKAAQAGHRTFENPKTGEKVRFDKSTPGTPGHQGKDHYHVYNTKTTGRNDTYLDKHGKPCPQGSHESHIYPEGQDV